MLFTVGVHVEGVRLYLNCGHQQTYFIPQIYESGEPWWNHTDRGKRKNSEITCPSATLFTTNPTLTDPGANLGLGERPATNLMIHGTIPCSCYMFYQSHSLWLYGTNSIRFRSQWTCSEAALIAWTLRLWIRILLKALIFVVGVRCCVVLCR
jgi:hypothetical protein